MKAIDHPILRQVKTGDAWYVTGTSLVPRTIMKEMHYYGKKHSIDYDYVFSHAGTLFWLHDDLYVAEAIENSYNPTRFLDDYNLTSKSCMITRPIHLHASEEKMVRFLMKQIRISTFYPYWGVLVAWPVYNHTGINLFGRGGGRVRMYCYEGRLDFLHGMMPEYYPERDEIVPFFDLTRTDDKIIYDHYYRY